MTAIARLTISASPSRSTNTAKGPPLMATRMGRLVTRLMSMNNSHFRRSLPACPKKSTGSQKTLEKCSTTLFSVPMPMLRIAASLAFERAGVKLTCACRNTRLPHRVVRLCSWRHTPVKLTKQSGGTCRVELELRHEKSCRTVKCYPRGCRR